MRGGDGRDKFGLSPRSHRARPTISRASNGATGPPRGGGGGGAIEPFPQYILLTTI